jgi:hypothetical protein
VYWSFALRALTPPGVVTVTPTTPVPAGAVAVMLVSLATEMFVAGVAPKFTADAPVRPVPVIVTVFPPAVGPDEGATPVTVGGADCCPAVMETFCTR